MPSDELIPTGAGRADERAALAPAVWRLAALAGLLAIVAVALLRRRHRSLGAAVAGGDADAPRGPGPAEAPADRELDARRAASAAATPAAPRTRRVHVGVLAGVLLALGAGGAVLIAASATRDDEPGTAAKPATWSSWAPARTSRRSVPQQIAAHFAPRYRLDGGAQAVQVRGGPLKLTNLPLTVAIRSPGTGRVRLIDSRQSILYRLCGLGDDCAVTPGRPTPARHLLLRREALELALYTLHYTAADHVVVFMPPRAGIRISQGGQALLFERRVLARRLRLPVDVTLTDEVPRPASIGRSSDRVLVDQQTIPALHNFAFRETPQATRAFLVLDPIYVTPAQPRGTPGAHPQVQPV